MNTLCQLLYKANNAARVVDAQLKGQCTTLVSEIKDIRGEIDVVMGGLEEDGRVMWKTSLDAIKDIRNGFASVVDELKDERTLDAKAETTKKVGRRKGKKTVSEVGWPTDAEAAMIQVDAQRAEIDELIKANKSLNDQVTSLTVSGRKSESQALKKPLENALVEDLTNQVAISKKEIERLREMLSKSDEFGLEEARRCAALQRGGVPDEDGVKEAPDLLKRRVTQMKTENGCLKLKNAALEIALDKLRAELVTYIQKNPIMLGLDTERKKLNEAEKRAVLAEKKVSELIARLALSDAAKTEMGITSAQMVHAMSRMRRQGKGSA